MGVLVVAWVMSAGGEDRNDTLEELKSLGYIDSAPTDNPEDRGVVWLTERAYRGQTLLSSRHRATAQLLDIRGTIIKKWRDSAREPWMHVELQPGDELLALAKDRHLVRLDASSKVLWRLTMRAHHDFTVASDERILVLSRRRAIKRFGGLGALPVLEDLLVWVSRDGQVESEHSVFDLVADQIPPRKVARLRRLHRRGVPARRLTTPEFAGDLTHANAVRILHRAIPDIAPAGAVLLSLRELDRIVIVDEKLEAILWAWGEGELEGQHHATQIDTGNILVFDNGVRRKRSRALEIDPVGGAIVWRYTAPKLYTRLRGAAQKLPNGNVLITESDSGHAIEVTEAGEKVWEFWNPEVRKRAGRDAERDAIYRLIRYPRNMGLP